MRISEFIRSEVLLPRLRAAQVLVVYDPARRYRELCLSLAAGNRIVVDASESSIEAREEAQHGLLAVGQPNTSLDSMLVYVPALAPLTDEDRQRDPFATYGACGAVFPDTDGDEYLSLCLRARADHATEIRRIFAADPNPSFAVIDAVGGGAGWPELQTLLRVESARDILLALLAPSNPQRDALKGHEAWAGEAKALCQGALGLKLTTRAKTLGPVADELWRFLLFSEFAFDLPGQLPANLPAALVDVPRAGPEARPLVEDLCDHLRSDIRTQQTYIDRAEAIERELNLPAACSSIVDLGVKDTFPFEERSFFAQAAEALKRDDSDRLRTIIAKRSGSVWMGRGENQGQWSQLGAAAALIEACGDGERQLPENARSQEALVDFYTGSLREVDRLQREFEGAAGDLLAGPGVAEATLTEVTAHARSAYRRLADQVQSLFVRHLEKSGWPPAGRLANADVFDKLMAPRLAESGRRVALLLIDALRYELGIELTKGLAGEGQVNLQAAYVSLPSVTPVGMASLLPGAGRDLRLARLEGNPAPVLGGAPLRNVGQRMDVLAARYGQRFTEGTLRDFVRGALIVPAPVELLVLRSNEMDNDFEANPEAAPGLIGRTFQQVRFAMRRLREVGFVEVVIATDHGFYLNTAGAPGDLCPKPPGTWIVVHERMLLGDGRADAANWVLPAANLGIRGDYSQAAGPRAMVAYRTGETYFHGGASLQEAVAPVIELRLRAPEAKTGKAPKVTLNYRRGAKRITTRRPVLEVLVGGGDLLSMDIAVEILLEAQDAKGNVVGEAAPGGAVNPATRTLSLTPGPAGLSVQVTLRMDETYEGKFSVKALDPNTLAAYAKLDLETDYTV